MLDATEHPMVPPGTVRSLVLYAEQGVPLGHFLAAVLSNDLFDACGRADTRHQHTLFNVVSFIYNELPRGSWGSRAAYDAWVEHRGLQGLRDAQEPEVAAP